MVQCRHLPLTIKSSAMEMLSTLVCTAHVYFPACLSWIFRIIISPAECCCHSTDIHKHAHTHRDTEFHKSPAIVIQKQCSFSSHMGKYKRAHSYVCMSNNKSIILTAFTPYPMKGPDSWEQIQLFPHRKSRNTAVQKACF